MRCLRLEYPDLPPSENGIRQVRWGRGKGGRPKALGMCYTPEAENYKTDFAAFVQKHHFVDVQKFRRSHEDGMVYSLRLIFYFPPEQILNKGWLKRGKSRAKTPHKKMDVGNRRKLLEDALSEAIDLDDSLFFSCEQHKGVSEDPKVVVILTEEDPRLYNIPASYFPGGD